jgi:hypothetical protein
MNNRGLFGGSFGEKSVLYSEDLTLGSKRAREGEGGEERRGIKHVPYPYHVVKARVQYRTGVGGGRGAI